MPVQGHLSCPGAIPLLRVESDLARDQGSAFYDPFTDHSMAACAGLVLAPGSHNLPVLVPYALSLSQMTDPRPEGTSTHLTLSSFNF